MKNTQTLIAALLGLICGLLIVLVVQTSFVSVASGQTTTSGPVGDWLMGVGTISGGKLACFLFNTKDMKIGLYSSSGTGLRVEAIRSCQWDFKFQQYGRNYPSIPQMMKEYQKSGGKATR